jgi:hypothetical protein
MVFRARGGRKADPTPSPPIFKNQPFFPLAGLIWANLVVVRCSVIVPDHYVMTSAGLKRVVRVER